MNPLFLAHLVADFLLQPGWLVRWKQSHRRGVVLHSLIHALVMAPAIIPRRLDTALIIGFIALSHGLIDTIKIRWQKNARTFSLFFLADQVMHLLVLAVMSTAVTDLPALWKSNSGWLIFATLFSLSYGVAWRNLSHLENFPLQNGRQRLARFFLLTLLFALFFRLSLGSGLSFSS